MASVGDSGETLSLNVMPLLDIFSILILFLLGSFSTDPVSHDLNTGTELPDSVTIRALDEIPTIAVSKTQIMVQDKNVVAIRNGDVDERNRSQGAIAPLFVELQKLAENNKRIVKQRKMKKSAASTLTMEMDKGHPFKLVRRIMLSAQQAEFITFKLMVAKEIN